MNGTRFICGKDRAPFEAEGRGLAAKALDAAAFLVYSVSGRLRPAFGGRAARAALLGMT